jgi:(1->4)-alpha-D-glucan 1-alpha-D-glucosylmutase
MTTKDALLPRIPVSTYRLQFGPAFTFLDAMKIVPYLNGLGITDIYASPCFKARKGSTHGYDVIDPNTLNPELGGEKAFNRLTAILKEHGMGLILDIVPNHMCVESEENLWWMDVLENGPSSAYADFFDIDWHPIKKELENRVLIPVLGDQYGTVLENGELSLVFEKGAFFVRYHDYKFPILPETYADILQQGADAARSKVSSGDPNMVELLSIITALGCLPAYTEKGEERLIERHREKEIIKGRLKRLYRGSPAVRSIIDEDISSLNGTKGNSQTFDLLDTLLSKQVWRLSHWRVATDEINYRRFFDINSLAAIRMEDPSVFQKTHDLVSRLVGEGKVTGLRVDHPDGLYNPAEYFRRLQRECFFRVRFAALARTRDKTASLDKALLLAEVRKEYEEGASSDPQFKPFYIIGEKILTKGEYVPEGWPIFSTIGYAFLNPLNGIFVDIERSKAFDQIYNGFIRSKPDYQDLVYEKKKLIMLALMSGEINTLAHYLDLISERSRYTRDFTRNSLKTAIMETIACFPVYRTYITPLVVNERDLRYIEQAITKAKGRNPALSATIFDFLQRVLQLHYPEKFCETDKTEWVDFVMRFQQVTSPVMAKGLEDTVFYVYNRLVSLNEVGGNPERFGTTLEAFHGKNIETAKSSPCSQITTSTHDTKRSEDARARLNVLSEVPDEWRSRLIRWSKFNKRKKPLVNGRMVPDRNEEYLLYQTLLGIWPFHPPADHEHEAFKTRIKNYMLKAVKEAKINSSWISPDSAYEEALSGFVDTILSRSAANLFMQDFNAFQTRISYFGIFNSLSQTLLKIISPGVPDFYQGTELWDFSLVDPDNRGPVDFKMRKKKLKKVMKGTALERDGLKNFAKALLRKPQDDDIKLYVTFMSLKCRNENRDLFKHGLYIPLTIEGSAKESVCAFVRILGEQAVLAAVPRFLTRLLKGIGEMPFGRRAWADTAILIPGEIPPGGYRNIFTGDLVEENKQNGKRGLLLSDVFANFPVALLRKQTLR